MMTATPITGSRPSCPCGEEATHTVDGSPMCPDHAAEVSVPRQCRSCGRTDSLIEVYRDLEWCCEECAAEDYGAEIAYRLAVR